MDHLGSCTSGCSNVIYHLSFFALSKHTRRRQTGLSKRFPGKFTLDNPANYSDNGWKPQLSSQAI